MATMTDDWESIVEAMIAAMEEVMGEVALVKAKKAHVRVRNGEVAGLSEDGRDVAGLLLGQYEDTIGIQQTRQILQQHLEPGQYEKIEPLV